MAPYDVKKSPMAPGHIEKSFDADSSAKKAALDFALLMDPDVAALGVTDGGFGVLAAQLSRKPFFTCRGKRFKIRNGGHVLHTEHLTLNDA